MTRDEFIAGAGDTFSKPGRQLFLVAIDSGGRETERNLRQGLLDYFGSLAGGVRRISDQPSTDQVIDVIHGSICDES